MQINKRGRGLMVMVVLSIAYAVLLPFSTFVSCLDSTQITENIRRLWSVEFAERQKAKDNLVMVGDEAVPSLLVLLDDILHNQQPRFALGKEEEGKIAWEYYNNLPSEKKTLAEYENTNKFEISRRLRNDILEILGRMKSEKAVPYLTKELWKRQAGSGMPQVAGPGEQARPFKRTLIQIGSSAVPDLISVLESTDSKTNIFGEPITEHSKQIVAQAMIINFQSDIVTILSEIGDVRALPVLYRLKNAKIDPSFTRYLINAINKIQAKNGIK